MMSNLLFDERPLVIQPQLAVILGDLEEAVILQQINYWTQKNSNIRDGYSWVYNTMADWQKQFPWIKSDKTLRKKFKSLEDKGLLVTGNYNKAKFDRTKWYRIDYDAFSQMVNAFGNNYRTIRQELPNGSGKSYPTYTIDYTETTTDKIDSQTDSGLVIKEFIEFWETNIGFMPPIHIQDFMYEYNDWKAKGVEHDEIIAIFKKALTAAIGYNARDKKKYTLKILRAWLNNNLLSTSAIEGEEKQFKKQMESKHSNNNYKNNSYMNKPNEAW